MDLFEKQNEELFDYVHHCKHINKWKLVHRFRIDARTAYKILDKLIEEEEIAPVDGFNFLVMFRTDDREE